MEKETDNPFEGISSICTWYVPSGTTEMYKAQPWWVPSWQIIEDAETKKSDKASYSDGVLSVNGVQYNMLPVEGGTFMMGTTDEIIAAGCQRFVIESEDTVTTYQSVKEVTVGNYMIGETEVTQALWTAVMGDNPSEWKGDNLPVGNINWMDCLNFIFKLNILTGMNFRLPTEAEWEFAARGGNKSKHTPYSGGSNLDDVAWYDENSYERIHPVKQKRANELGLFDMTGNVREYCNDKEISCGGSIISNKAFADVSDRVSIIENSAGSDCGFRLAIGDLPK